MASTYDKKRWKPVMLSTENKIQLERLKIEGESYNDVVTRVLLTQRKESDGDLE